MPGKMIVRQYAKAYCNSSYAEDLPIRLHWIQAPGAIAKT
jgi:hypothetical protein